MADRKPRKAPSEATFRRASIHLAYSYAPPIKECKKCGWPVADGFCCPECGTDDPDNLAGD